jgi:hypothetical protein
VKTLLVIDAFPGAKSSWLAPFRIEGHRILHAKNDFQVRELLKFEKPEFVIVSVDNAEGQAMEYLRLFRALDPNVTVFFYLLDFNHFNLDQALQNGLCGVFQRPNFQTQIVETVLNQMRLKPKLSQRRSGRVSVSLPILVRLGLEPNAQETTVVNLSTGGLYLRWEQALPPNGSSVQFLFPRAFTFSTDLKGRGTVRWHQEGAQTLMPRGFGIEFTEMSSEALSEIISYVQEVVARQAFSTSAQE